MQQPEVKGNTRRQVQDAMRAILGYRSFFDLRRGWRFNNPNLEQLGLVRIAYQDIDELAADEAEWVGAPQSCWRPVPPSVPKSCETLFETMRQGLCIATRYLDSTELDQLRTQSYANLREPWGFTEDERPVPAKWFVTTRPRDDAGPRGRKLKIDEYLVIGSSRSRLGRELRKGSTWGGANPYYRQVNDKQLPRPHRRPAEGGRELWPGPQGGDRCRPDRLAAPGQRLVVDAGRRRKPDPGPTTTSSSVASTATSPGC